MSIFNANTMKLEDDSFNTNFLDDTDLKPFVKPEKKEQVIPQYDVSGYGQEYQEPENQNSGGYGLLEWNNEIPQETQEAELPEETGGKTLMQILKGGVDNVLLSIPSISDIYATAKGAIKGGETLLETGDVSQALDEAGKARGEGIIQKNIINPLGRTAYRFGETMKEGLTGEKMGEVETPFGKVKPYQEQGALDYLESFLEAIPVIAPEAEVTSGMKEITKTPLVKSLAKKMATAIKKIAPHTTNIDETVFEEVLENPELHRRALQVVRDMPEEPYLGIAYDIGRKLYDYKQEAQQLFSKGAEVLSNSNLKFNVAPSLDGTEKVLRKFGLTMKGLKNKPIQTAEGLIKDAVQENKTINTELVGKGKITPFSKKTRSVIQGLVDMLHDAKDLEAEDLPRILEKFDEAYNALPLGANKTPTKAHALVMGLKEATDNYIRNIIPPELKAGYQMYSNYHRMMKEIGNKIIDGKGELKDGAENAVKSIGYANKGIKRAKLQAIAKELGVDIPEMVKAVKNAKALSAIFPATGGRTLDILRSLLITGGTTLGGVVTGNVPMAITGALSSSPKAVGELTLKVGEMLKQAGADEKIIKEVTQLSPEAWGSIISLFGKGATNLDKNE